jgi:hypothetical protein
MTGMQLSRWIAMVVTICIGTPAFALISKSDPFGNSGSVAAIGRDPNDGNSHWIGWKESGTNNCSWQWIADGAGLNDDLSVAALGGNDTVIIAYTTWSSWCGFDLMPPILNGYSVDIYGGDGVDALVGSSSWGLLSGGPGDDWLETYSISTWITGEDGNDSIYSGATTGSGSYTSGGSDNDCVQVHTGQTSPSSSCGSGTDNWAGPGTRPADCENTVSHC